MKKDDHASKRGGLGWFRGFLAIFPLFVLSMESVAQRSLPTTDPFDYSAGPLQVVGQDWVRISGTGNDLVVSDGNTTYNGYLGAIGRKAVMTNGANDDLKLNFTGQSSAGTIVYSAFVLKVTNTTGLTSSGAYCFILGSGTNNFAGRVFIKGSGTGFSLGISKTAAAPASWSSILSVGVSYLVVTGYEIMAGSSNDVAALWINPIITTTAPPADFSTSAGSDFGGGTSIDGFILRQTTGSPSASVDDISIATSWSDLFKNPVYTATGSISNGSFTNIIVSGPSTTLSLTGNIDIAGTLTLSDASIIPASNLLSYGSSGILKYNGTLSQTSACVEFPVSNGPKDLIIDNPIGVILPFDRTIPGLLTITTGSFLIINPVIALTIQGPTNLNGTDCLVLKSDETGTASFIDNGTITGQGTAKIERLLTGYSTISDGSFHFISSPVNNQPIQPDFVNNPPDPAADFYRWDEPASEWINSKNNTGGWNSNFETDFQVGKGYMLAYPGKQTKNFSGTLQTTPPATPLVINCTHTGISSGGWNLLGNPYPSALDWEMVNRSPGVDNALYYYDASIQNYRYYIRYLQGFSVGNGSRYIPSMQGFMVHVSDLGTHTISMDNSCRFHHSQTLFYKNSIIGKKMLSVLLERDSLSDETFIVFLPHASDRFDPSFDALKLYPFNTIIPQTFTLAGDGSELAINAVPEDSKNLVLPLGIRTGYPSMARLSFTGTDSFEPGAGIYLEDLAMGSTQDLTRNPVYTFYSNGEKDSDRFRICFKVINDLETPKAEEHISIRIEGNSAKITIPEEEKLISVTVFDLFGIELVNRTDCCGRSISILLPEDPGLYLIKVTDNTNRVTKKVLIY